MKRLILLTLMIFAPLAQGADGVHAIAMHGEPKYGPGFEHFDYVNADAPKGGVLSRHVVGSFDTLNPFIPKGTAAQGIDQIYDSLTVRSQDEPFTQYGLLAESMEIPEDRESAVYHLREEATFADGHGVTASDVVFTFETVREKGSPFYSYYYKNIDDVTAVDEHTVRFVFTSESNNRELPLIVGQMNILPEHYWADRDFAEGSLDKPLGSGPYRVKELEAGKRIVYERREDYWGKDLAVNQGRHNFDRLVFEYFLDDNVAMQAFKGGTYNFRAERNSKLWATAYEGPALNQGKIIQEEIPHSRPVGMQGFVFNERRDLFQDRTLRRALSYALDFEWSNKNLFYGQYKRTRSFFQNSELAARGQPSEAELDLLEPWRDELPEAVFQKAYQPPTTDGEGRPRENLKKARQMLFDAGYEIVDGRLKTPSGEPVTFQILLQSSAFERIVMPFAKNLEALGVKADVRKVDQTQYQERLREFDFDMVVGNFPQSNSPGNEQRDFWHSSAADSPGSRNLIGLQSPVVDELVGKIISAPDREALVTRCRALDRVLQWGFHVIPNWHVDYFRLAYRRQLAHPENMPDYGMALNSWWHADAE
jgi:microcin C transport system substrate-binding protein